MVGCISAAIGALVALACQQWLAPPRLKLASVDVTAVVAAEVTRLKDSGMERARAEAYAQLWGPLLQNTAQAIAEEYGVVLLVSPSVVAGAPDLTADLKERLDREVQAFQ
jgi:hypothetical protein